MTTSLQDSYHNYYYSTKGKAKHNWTLSSHYIPEKGILKWIVRGLQGALFVVGSEDIGRGRNNAIMDKKTVTRLSNNSVYLNKDYSEWGEHD